MRMSYQAPSLREVVRMTYPGGHVHSRLGRKIKQATSRFLYDPLDAKTFFLVSANSDVDSTEEEPCHEAERTRKLLA